MNGKKVLVTGGSGFIGHHLVRRLLADGASVGVIVRYGNVMKNERLRSIWDRISIFEADVRNRGALEAVRAFAPQIVFHLAAYNHVGASFLQVEECFDVNAKGTANVVDTFTTAEKIVCISTSEVYGMQREVPFVETMGPEPISPYAITKFAGELYCRLKQRENSGPSIVILRPFNAFGPYQSSKAVIPELIMNCLLGRPVQTTEGKQTREFNYVGDLVDGMIRAAQHAERIEGPINLGCGHDINISDLVMKIAKLTASKSKIEVGALRYRPTEIWRMYCDNSRATRELGWQPETTIDEGLRLSVEWFRRYLEAYREMEQKFHL
ncbi:MAG TPA: SDR family NAD(P)-dependent oxidoreductase [Candidatus Binataceae bacterium]